MSGFLVQSRHGTKGNFEVVAPRVGGGLAHHWRDNDAASQPWHGPSLAFGSRGDEAGVALVSSSYGNLEVVVQEKAGSRSGETGRLAHAYRDDAGTLRWSGATTLPGSDVASGVPGFIQSRIGTPGNFEVVAPHASGGLAHWWRDNGQPGQPWSNPTRFGQGAPAAASLIQSNYGGNLEVVARDGNVLVHYWRDAATLRWNGPAVIPGSSGVQGAPAFIQGRFGTKGNFEVVAPLASGGLGHWWRDNDDPSLPWHGPTRFASGSFDAVGLVQSNYGSGPGNLEVVARAGETLVHWWREDASPWTWHGPVPVAPPAAPAASRAGLARAPRMTQGVSIHMALLRTRKVVGFGFPADMEHMPDSRLFDLQASLAETEIDPTPELFCSGHAFLPDGRLLVAGGHGNNLRGVHTLDPQFPQWKDEGTMSDARWYPTCTTLPDGRILVISGSGGNGGPVQGNGGGGGGYVNNSLQYFSAATGLTRNGVEDIETLPSPWSRYFPSGFNTIDLYPFVFVLPDGRLLVHSRNTTRFYDPVTRQWETTQVPAVRAVSRTYPGQGSGVLLALRPSASYKARVLVVGGGGQEGNQLVADTPATATAEILDLGASSPAWRATASMASPRVFCDAVLLPDGKVFVVGGSRSGRADHGMEPVLTPEIFDPDAETWTTMAPQHVARMYHGSAILLPDATVLLAGKDGIYQDPAYKYPERRLEVFEPPYLHTGGTRPTISSAPASVAYGQGFSVQTPNANSIAQAVLVKPGAVTHQFNMDQRLVELSITARGPSGLTVSAPPNPKVAPPGHYMLFVLDGQGVPSEASFVQLR